jgi:hypothetical protein
MRGLLLALPLLSIQPVAIAAQRFVPENFRDSLALVSDTAGLRRAASMTAADATGLLAKGLAALRLYALTLHESDATRALAAFDEATQLERDNAWAWYGLGLAWSARAERPPPKVVAGQALAEALGLDAGSRALRAFRRALEVDPGFSPAAESIVPLAIARRDRAALDHARRVLAADEQNGRFAVDALLALADAEAALGNLDAAASAATRAATLANNRADQPVASYRLATVLFLHGDDERGANAWFAAIDSLTTALEARVFADLETVADDHERERWQGSDRRARQLFLRTFWDVRAALAGVSTAERIGSHYRRLAGARDRFPRRRKWGAPPANALLLERPDLPFDDRGLIFIRHGEPDHIVRTPNAFAPPSESWVYRQPDGGFRVLHFDNYASGTRSLGVVGNPEATAGEGGMGDAYNEYVLIYNLPCDAQWAGDRAAYDRRLALLRCNEFDRRSISAEVRRDARAALRTDSDHPDYSRDLPFAFDAFTFRGSNRLTDVTTAIVVSADTLDTTAGAALDLSLILADTLFSRVTRLDTTVRWPTPPAAGALLRLHATQAVSPGMAVAQRLALRDAFNPAHGRLAGASLEIPDYSGSQLMISDIVLASPDSAGTFRRGDVSLSLVPTREFPAAAFHVFYEVYNLAADAAYETELVLERRQGGLGGTLRRLLSGGSVVQLRFRDVAPGDPTVRELRRIEAALPAGDYRLRIRVTDRSTGQRSEQSREFTVER